MCCEAISGISPWALALVLTTSLAWADQTDKRLEPLFATLQSSESVRVQRETESAIWQIWFEFRA